MGIDYMLWLVNNRDGWILAVKLMTRLLKTGSERRHMLYEDWEALYENKISKKEVDKAKKMKMNNEDILTVLKECKEILETFHETRHPNMIEIQRRMINFLIQGLYKSKDVVRFISRFKKKLHKLE